MSKASTSGKSGVSLPKPNHYQAQSDPDGMENGGVDQPGGTGGVNTSAQDGNNGSGNDLDCEDDNRGQGVPGHCKQRPKTCTNHGLGTQGKGHAHGRATRCAATGTPVDSSTEGGSASTARTVPPQPSTTRTTGLPAAGSPETSLPESALAAPGFSAHDTAPSGVVEEGTLPQVLGIEAFAPAAGAVSARASRAAPTVAGVEATAGTAAGPMAALLPNTGAGKALVGATVFGLLTLVAGGALMLRRRPGSAV